MTLNVAIIGTGFAGLCMAIKLKQAGVDSFIMFEKAQEIGGVWRDNVYPGAACDLPSHLYSFSFEHYRHWSRTYASQPEILDYLRTCADKYAIRSHIKFGAEVTHAAFDADAAAWQLRTAGGEKYLAKALVTATGQLNRPSLPSISGMDEFKGRTFHSAQWDSRHEMKGRRVAVIGNGCSAVQLVPHVAERARELSVFQRSPKWVIPKWDRELGSTARWLYDRVVWPQKVTRSAWFALAETIAYSPTRQGLLGRGLTLLARSHLRRQVADEELRTKLTPNFPFGCNRMILSNDYYPSLMRANVELVTDAITRIGTNGIHTSDGRLREVDTIIYATGFRSTRFLAPIEVTGPGGRLADVWRDGASAYLGIAVPGFPNLFMLYGPNTSSTNNSVIYMIESQVGYVMQCLDMLRKGGTIEPSRHAFSEYQNDVESWLGQTVWSADCRSWYKSESGRITNTWPLRAYRYRLATRRPSPAHFVTTPPPGAAI